MKETLLLLVLLPLALYATASPAQADERTSTLEIAANATVQAMPNKVTLSFAVETDAPLAKDAVEENAEKTEKILAGLKKAMGENGKIKTSGFNLFPVYDKEDTTRPGGFRVSNQVIVESRALDGTGAFIDAGVKAGANRISNLTFTTDKEEDLRRDAAVKALNLAKTDAEALAKASGLTIKRIIRITYDQEENAPMGLMRQASAAGFQTPISVGEISVTAGVHVIFEVQ